MNKLPNLIEIAEAARQEVYDLADKVPLNTGYVIKHNLAGACGAASCHLLNKANKRGIEPLFVQGQYNCDGHCWIEYCGCIIDITATQFFPARHVHVALRHRAKELYRPSFRTKNLNEAERQVKSWAIYHEDLRALA